MADSTKGRQASGSASMPTYDRLIWPTLQALKLSGGSGTIQEIEQKVAELEHFTETQMAVPHGRGKMTEVGYRQYWSRHYLKVVGAISRSSRGVWAITEIGRGMTEADAKRIPGEVRKRLKDRESPESGPPPDGEGTSYAAQEDTEEAPPHDGQIPLGIDDQEEEPPYENWQDALLDVLLAMTPDAFERLCRRVLREKGFENVVVTGGKGDNGIDGTAILRADLLSYRVFFQCKRYSGSISPKIVREFRGAMQGRTERGLLITTGTFTTAAEKEAVKDGAPIIDLIPGKQLCDLLKTLGLGVATRIVSREEITVDAKWFATL